jgi:glycosyltransferase involved in cell wall biosynthesis
MVMNYNISIIVPHKNKLKLLERCLNSIPERDDIEVIIVDDNSEEKYKNNLPCFSRANTKVFFF